MASKSLVGALLVCLASLATAQNCRLQLQALDRCFQDKFRTCASKSECMGDPSEPNEACCDCIDDTSSEERDMARAQKRAQIENIKTLCGCLDDTPPFNQTQECRSCMENQMAPIWVQKISEKCPNLQGQAQEIVGCKMQIMRTAMQTLASQMANMGAQMELQGSQFGQNMGQQFQQFGQQFQQQGQQFQGQGQFPGQGQQGQGQAMNLLMQTLQSQGIDTSTLQGSHPWAIIGSLVQSGILDRSFQRQFREILQANGLRRGGKGKGKGKGKGGKRMMRQTMLQALRDNGMNNVANAKTVCKPVRSNNNRNYNNNNNNNNNNPQQQAWSGRGK